MLRRSGAAAMCVAIAAGLLLLAAGAWRLDEAYLAGRFTIPARQCPLGIWGDVVTPLCYPARGW